MLVTELIWGLTRYFALLMTDLMPKVFPRTSDPTNSRTIRVSFVFWPSTSECLLRFGVLGMFLGSKYLLRRCLDVYVGWNFGRFSDEKSHASSCNFLWVLEDLGMENKTCFFLCGCVFFLGFLWIA